MGKGFAVIKDKERREELEKLRANRYCIGMARVNTNEGKGRLAVFSGSTFIFPTPLLSQNYGTIHFH